MQQWQQQPLTCRQRTRPRRRVRKWKGWCFEKKQRSPFSLDPPLSYPLSSRSLSLSLSKLPPALSLSLPSAAELAAYKQKEKDRMFFLPSNATIPEPGNGTSQRTNPLGAVKQVQKRWWWWREMVVERGGGDCFVFPLRSLAAALPFSAVPPPGRGAIVASDRLLVGRRFESRRGVRDQKKPKERGTFFPFLSKTHLFLSVFLSFFPSSHLKKKNSTSTKTKQKRSSLSATASTPTSTTRTPRA